MLIDRWPNFLQDILEFRKIAEAEQPEFDGAIQAVESLHHEFSIFTVTEIGAAGGSGFWVSSEPRGILWHSDAARSRPGTFPSCPIPTGTCCVTLHRSAGILQ